MDVCIEFLEDKALLALQGTVVYSTSSVVHYWCNVSTPVAWVTDLSHHAPPLGTLVRDVWESQPKIPYWWHQNYPDLGSGSDWFLPKNTRSTRVVKNMDWKVNNTVWWDRKWLPFFVRSRCFLLCSVRLQFKRPGFVFGMKANEMLDRRHKFKKI